MTGANRVYSWVNVFDDEARFLPELPPEVACCILDTMPERQADSCAYVAAELAKVPMMLPEAMPDIDAIIALLRKPSDTFTFSMISTMSEAYPLPNLNPGVALTIFIFQARIRQSVHLDLTKTCY